MNQHQVGIMVAPNGARLTKTDHPAIPVTEDETVQTVRQCVDVGAQAVHLHVRNDDQTHSLDVARYQSIIKRLKDHLAADFPIQVTTEAVGVYTAAEQVAMVKTLVPGFASVALSEIVEADLSIAEARAFYHWASETGVGLQHILYTPEHLQTFVELKDSGVIPEKQWSLLFVLGRYTVNQQSNPADLHPFLEVLERNKIRKQPQWMICAFGKHETDCLLESAREGGHIRVGFENNRLHADGQVAPDNASRVQAVVNALPGDTPPLTDALAMQKLLGRCF